METFGSIIIFLIIMAILLFSLVGFITRLFKPNGNMSNNGSMICQNCGTRGEPKTITKGSIAIEIVLWICFIIPGLIYSIWRLTSKQQGCPSCGQPGMIGVDTPNGRALAEKLRA